MMDEIEFVDREYEKCAVEKAPRQIKTRKFSFSSIREKWNNFRIARLEKKLDKMKDSALESGYTDDNFESKIEKKATVIARLEEKIKVLSREDVPENYVKRRAIKLKKKMCENLSYNSGNIYSIGIDKKDEIFATEDPEEVLNEEYREEDRRIREEISRNVSEIMDKDKMESVSGDDLRAAVNETFEEMEMGSEVQTEASPVVSGDEVRDAVNETFEEMGMGSVAQTEASPVVSGDEVRDAVNETFEEMEKGSEVQVDETPVASGDFYEVDTNNYHLDDGGIDVSADISRDAVKEAVNEAFSEVKTEDAVTAIPEIVDPFVEEEKTQPETVLQEVVPQGDVRLSKEEIEAAINEVINRIKISKNKSSAVKFEKYNEDGTKRSKNDEYVYTPMTDEEIRASQEKLGFDEHGNLINPTNNNKVEEYTYVPMTDEEIRASQEKLGFDEHGNLVNPPKADYDVVATAKVVDDERSPLYVESGVSSLKDSTERTARTVEKNIDYNFESDGEDLEEFVEVEANTATGAVVPTEAKTDESVASKIEDYNALKEKLLQLQKQQALTMQKKEAAQKEAEEAADAALKIKQEYEASEKSVSRSMEMLKAYTDALAEDCERNVTAAELAENDARINKNFIDVQRGKVDANNRLIDEIDSLIGPRAVPDSIKVR